MRMRLAHAMVAAAAALATAAPGASAATEVRRYTPYTESGEIKPAIVVVAERDGECWSGSIIGRSDAWRCHAGRWLFDPCFESPVEDIALCPRFPGSGRVTMLRDPDFSGESGNTGTRGRIWALRAGRFRCQASSGARSVVAGRAPTFFCRPGVRRGWAVWGRLDRRNATWRARVGPHDASRWRWHDVSVAWR